MINYIDAEKLKAEIRKLLIPTVHDRDYDEWEHGRDSGFIAAISIIESLQQEQPEVDLDLDADIEMEWDSFNKHLAEYGGESEEVVWLNRYNFNEIARHFYELRLNAKNL